MRFKKSIIFLCLFTFLMLPIKPQKAHAVDVVVTPTVLFLCLALATGVGVVVTNQNVAEDVAKRVYNGLTSAMPHDKLFSKEKDKIILSITPWVLEKVFQIASDLPTSPITLPGEELSFNKVITSINNSVNKKPFNTTDEYLNLPSPIVFTSVLPTITSSHQIYMNFKVGYGDSTDMLFTNKKAWSWLDSSHSNGVLEIRFIKSYSGYSLRFYVDGQSVKTNVDLTTSSSWYNYSLEIVDFGNMGTVIGAAGEDIPYNEDTNGSISADIYNGWFPLGTGSISAPIEHPLLGSGSISADKPQSNLGDLVGALGGSVSADGTKPDIDTGEGDITQGGFFSGVLDYLSSIFDYIKAIFTNIVSFPTFLKELFIPSEFKPIVFTPLFQNGISNAFPFSIPWDIKNIIETLNAPPKEPVFELAWQDETFTLDLTIYSKLFGIIRTFILITFTVWLAIKTRDIIVG